MIAIIGSGNVATHLYKALKEKTETCLVNPHHPEEIPSDVRLVIIAVADKAIEEVASKLPVTDATVAHTAGSIPSDVLKKYFKNYGVLYPLQTFTKNIPLDYSRIPVFVEASSPEAELAIKEIATLFSDDVREADSKARKKLHLASVFACNFTNALAGISEELLEDSGIDFSAILPLMHQTVDKLHNLSPKEAQTGPAARGDDNVMKAHVGMLENKPELQELYKLFSNYIRNKR